MRMRKESIATRFETGRGKRKSMSHKAPHLARGFFDHSARSFCLSDCGKPNIRISAHTTLMQPIA